MAQSTEEIAKLSVSLSLESQNFTKQMSTLNKQIKQADKDFKSAGKGVNNFENTFAGLNAKMQKTTKQLDLYNTKLKQQKEEYKKVQVDLEATKKKLNEIEQAQGKNSKAWKEQAQVVQRNAQRLTTLNSDINTTKSNIGKLTTEIQEIQEGFQKLSNSTKTAEEQLEEISRQADLNQSEFAKLGSELNGTGKYFKNLGNDMNKLSSQILTGKQKIEVYESEINSLNKTLSDSKEEHNKLSSEISKVEKKLSNAEKTFGENSNEAEELRQKLYKLKDTYNKLDKEINDNEKSLNDYQKELNDTQTEVNKLSKELLNLPFERIGTDLSNVGSKMSSIGSSMTSRITLPLVGVATAATAVGVEFDRTMSKVGAISGATGDDFDSLRNKALQLGSETKFSASQVAEAMTYMGMAGWDTTQILDGVNGVLALSTAGAVDLGTASDIVTDGLTAMSMSAKDCNDFVDIMASTITSSNTSVELMGETLKYVGPVAGSLGISMQDLAVSIGIMSNAGVKGSASGTALRSGLTRLISPTQKAYNTMEEFGIAIQKNSDGTVNLAKTNEHLREKIGKLDATTQASVVSTVFGKEAMSGWMAVINASEDDVTNLSASINGSTKITTYWSEEMEKAGLSTKETDKKLRSLNKIMEDNKLLADYMNLSTTDLGKAISLLGSDSKVTSKDIEKLLNGIFELQNPNKETKKAMEELNFEIVKLSDGSIDMDGTLQALRTSFAGMTKEEKLAKIESLNLKNGQEQLLEILSLTDNEFNNVTHAINETKGASEKLAEIMSENLGGEIDSMKSSLEGSLIKTFEALEPVLQGCIEKITELSNWYNELSDEERRQILTVAGVVACMGPLLVLLGNIVSFGANVTLILGGMTAAGGGLAGVLGALSTFALPVLIAALILLATMVGDNEKALYNLQEKWGSFGTIVSGVCEFVSGVVQLFLGNIINLILLVVDVIAAMLDGPGGKTMEDAWNNFGNRLAKTSEEAVHKMSLATTRGMSHLREATDEQLKGTIASMETILDEIPNIVDGKWGSASQKLGEQLANMDYTQLTILQGMNDTTQTLFQGITESMTIDQVTERINLNFKNLHQTGRLESEALTQDITTAFNLMNENMDLATSEGATKASVNISKGKDKVVQDTKAMTEEAGNNLEQTKKVADEKTKDAANLIQTNVKTGVANADKELNQLSKSTENNFNKANKTVTQNATEMYKGVKTSFYKMGQHCKQYATDMYKGVTTSAKKMADNAKKSATDMYKGVTTSTKKMADKAIADWNSIRDTYSKGIKGKITTTHTKINVNKDEEALRTIQAIDNKDTILNVARVTTAGSYYNNNTPQSVGFSRAVNDSSNVGLLTEIRNLAKKLKSTGETNESKIYLEVPFVADGRELARVSAVYMNGELQIINNRNARNRGDF